MRLGRLSLVVALFASWVAGRAGAAAVKAPAALEDMVAGSVFVSDGELPARTQPPQKAAADLRALAKKDLFFGADGRIRLHIIAFLAKPADDETVQLVIYDGRRTAAMLDVKVQKGDRVVTLELPLDAHDFAGDRKYTIAVEDKGPKHVGLAQGVLSLKKAAKK
jgi:hypothetical protein